MYMYYLNIYKVHMVTIAILVYLVQYSEVSSAEPVTPMIRKHGVFLLQEKGNSFLYSF